MDIFEFSNLGGFNPLEESESGMGYQILQMDSVDYVIINSDFFVELKELERRPYPITTERLRQLGKLTTKMVIGAQLKYRRGYSAQTNSHPPFADYADGTEVFIRFSAFNPDRRILPDGSVRPGTFCTTKNDEKEVPSGLAAVGRYALPSRLTHKYVYSIQPPKGTPIYFGTVTPNYGLAGGGVEVYFPNGCPKGSAKHNPINTIPIR
ncbi:hypothetical protein [Ekhidna sp.]|jgi:hypothetical protein|uniref:hypothetical protein n=1 Tax=Ekhidna sp. TaxID=2608089 RepID=UPI0032EB0DE6